MSKKKKKCVHIYLNIHGLSDYELESMKEKFGFFASNLALVFDLDYLSVSQLMEENK